LESLLPKGKREERVRGLLERTLGIENSVKVILLDIERGRGWGKSFCRNAEWGEDKKTEGEENYE